MHQRFFRQAFLIAVSIYIGCNLQGCSKSKEGEVGPKQAQPSEQSAETAYANRPLEFPADFPLPKYPGSQLELSQLKQKESASHTVLLTTNESVERVNLFYARALKADGWDITKVMHREGYAMLGATRDRRKATIMITETRAGNTVISLYATKE